MTVFSTAASAASATVPAGNVKTPSCGMTKRMAAAGAAATTAWTVVRLVVVVRTRVAALAAAVV